MGMCEAAPCSPPVGCIYLVRRMLLSAISPLPLTSLIGCGDFTFADVTALPDPCPLPEKEKKRSLDMREKLIYAPMCGVGGIVYDKVSNHC